MSNPISQEDIIDGFNDEDTCAEIQDTLDAMAEVCWSNSANHGFWPDGKERNKGEQVALIHSEASELLEAVRDKNYPQPSEHCPDISAEEEELADLIVRTLDYAHGHGLSIGKAFVHKMRFNALRPVKHGKKF